MCLAFYALKQHPDFPVIIAANRDEFYARPTQNMHWWDSPSLLAGKDLRAGGTWLGLNQLGQFAMVTNVREQPLQAGELSRGHLITDFFLTSNNYFDFFQSIEAKRYAGFNLVVGDLHQAELFYYSNRHNEVIQLERGLHGLSNAALNTAWPKVSSGKQLMHELCQKNFVIEDWFALLGDKTPAQDHELPDTGVGHQLEHLLSSRFIQSEEYGTRCSTIITVDNNNMISIYERSFDELGKQADQQVFRLT